jgi:molybdate transport system permease protein
MAADPMLLTLRLAALTTAVLLVLGAPVAWWLATARGRWRPWVEAALALPLVLPPTVLGFYLLLAMGSQGWLGRLWALAFERPLAFSFPGLWLAAVLVGLPFAIQPMLVGFSRVEPELYEAAWTLGATRWQAFWRIAVPLGAPGIATAAALCFAHTVGEFGVALMVGGNLPGETQTIALAIYDHVEALRFDAVHGTAAGLLAFSYAVLLGIFLLQRRAAAGRGQ